MTKNRAAVLLYSTRIPAHGWSGLPLLGIAAALAAVLPEAVGLLLAGLTGGMAMATCLVAMHRPR
jgi:hypothetical protein